MNEPLVSIITPVYNAERFLSDTIKSVQNQTYKNWEILLVDDCSKDNSLKIAKNLEAATDGSVLITDCETVIVAEGKLSFLKGEKLTLNALEIIKNKSSFSLSKRDGAKPVKITNNSEEDSFCQLIMPIFSGESNACGLVIICGFSQEKNYDATDIKLLKFVTQMLYSYFKTE